jgi:hypothetical protein
MSLQGFSLLYAASIVGKPDTVRLLLAHKADVNTCTLVRTRPPALCLRVRIRTLTATVLVCRRVGLPCTPQCASATKQRCNCCSTPARMSTLERW